MQILYHWAHIQIDLYSIKKKHIVVCGGRVPHHLQ